VSTWKVILATLVIFVAGLFTGSALLRKFGLGPFPPHTRPPVQGQMREEYVRRLTQDLQLTPAQVETVSKIMAQSQEQVRVIFDQVHKDIRAVLTPDQQRLFDELRQRRPGPPGGGPPERRNRFRRPPSLFESNRPAPPEPPPPRSPEELLPPTPEG
jgi:hypothetical protein